MRRLVSSIVLLSLALSCNRKELPVSAFKQSYDMLRKSDNDDVIIQDKLAYNIFWVVGDSYIERVEFNPNDPTEIVEHQIINNIETDEDYRIPINSSLYKDDKFDK